jgi:hypothetical protein
LALSCMVRASSSSLSSSGFEYLNTLVEPPVRKVR